MSRSIFRWPRERWAWMALALQFFLNRRRMRSIEISATQATYPVGAHVKVAVNPGDPGRSVLEPGLRYDDLIWIAAGLFFGLIGLMTGKQARALARTPSDALASVGTASCWPPRDCRYFALYNGHRPHTALDRKTPYHVYFESQPLAAAA